MNKEPNVEYSNTNNSCSLGGDSSKEKADYNPNRRQRELMDKAVIRLKKSLIEGNHEEMEDSLWLCIIAFQNHPFHTASGLPFTYELRKGRNGKMTKELWIDRREKSKSLAWSSVKLAFWKGIELKEVHRPKALGDIRGVSYIYPLLWQFGVITVPQEVERKMRGSQPHQSLFYEPSDDEGKL